MAEEILTHAREVIDTDVPFTIDPITKEIKPGAANLTLAQRAKNSERFTFTIPGTTIEGHDMTKCNSVLIHFQNISEGGSQRSIGIYHVEDLAEVNGSVTLSWLIGEEATVYSGALIFSIHFACFNENGEMVYNFPTLTFSQITVGETVWNSETIEKEYPDIIAEFNARIADLERPPEAVSARIVKAEDGTITITMPMSDGTTGVCMLNPGEDGWPVSVTVNGVTKPLEWEGF